jgi:hypothetical protein
MLPNHNTIVLHIPVVPEGINERSSICTFRRLPWYVLLPLHLTLMFFVLALTVRAAAILVSPLDITDVFLPYEAIMPSSTMAALGDYDCHINQEWEDIRYSFVNPPPHECNILPEQGAFQAITVALQDDHIQTLVFYSDTLQLGNLIEHWGLPVVARAHHQEMALCWDLGTYTVRASALHRFDGTPLRMVVITRSDPSSFG